MAGSNEFQYDPTSAYGNKVRKPNLGQKIIIM